MSYIFNVAVIGNGTTAVNAQAALAARLRQSPVPLPFIQTTIFGNEREEDCGRGIAHGALGGIFGNFTESADHADYGSVKGAFRRYAAARLGRPPDAITRVTRQLVGDFHTRRSVELKQNVDPFGTSVAYQKACVTDVRPTLDGHAVLAGQKVRTQAGSAILAGRKVIGNADHVVLAVGDILSTRFGSTIPRRAGQIEDVYNGQVFGSPHHALPHILGNNGTDRVIVALGTRSSFVDLANGLIANGFRGKIIGISTTGQTPWQARDEVYPLTFLKKDREFGTVREVLAALGVELSVAREKGAYVPDGLLKNVAAQQGGDEPKRLTGDFDFREEAAKADRLTYHSVAQSVDWEKIYENLIDDNERDLFRKVLSDFILYNRVNTIMSEDFRTFAANVASGAVEIRKDSFAIISVRPSLDGRIRIPLQSGGAIDADAIVNCAIGPASSYEQIEHSPLLQNLVEQGVLQPRPGTGFAVNGAHQDRISLLGVQARPYPFSSLGIETNGRQAEAWASALAEKLAGSVDPSTDPRHIDPRFERKGFGHD